MIVRFTVKKGNAYEDQDNDIYGRYNSNNGDGLGPELMAANTLIGNDVYS